MTGDTEFILDDLFHGCALAAFVEQAARQEGWPSMEATRRRAYDLYEEALGERDRARTTGFSFTSDPDCGMVGGEPTQMEDAHARNRN